MITVDIFQVDAFSSKLFGGNPAAVCPLKEWLPDRIMQVIAVENNLSETAFFVPNGDQFDLRWFTPKVEIDLCGHATLASAHVLFNHLGYSKSEINFNGKFVGLLSVKRKDGWLTLNFPAWHASPADAPQEVIDGLGGMRPRECYVKRDYMLVYPHEEDIRNAKPNFSLLGKVNRRICITAPGEDCDFVSRFFCAGCDGIDEDPVTGSAHSMLIPYWAKRLGKHTMLARQLSTRGGELRCELDGDRVHIGGQAQTYMQGKIFLPE